MEMKTEAGLLYGLVQGWYAGLYMLRIGLGIQFAKIT